MKLAWPIECAKEFTLGLLYPNVCQICQNHYAGRNEGYICADCRTEGVKQLMPPFCNTCGLPYRGEIDGPFTCGNCAELRLEFQSARAAVELTDMVLDVIHRYKYNRALWFEPFLQKVFTDAAGLAVSPETTDLIIPIPLHPVRMRDREFNQAERLASSLAKRTRVAIDNSLVARTTMTQTQTHLSRKERAENMRKAFSWKGRHKLHGERIVLVDDILTTGATASACAGVLKNHGAREVNVWTVARRVLK